jgi:hypothetical protein
MTRKMRRQTVDPCEYILTRMEWLVEERAKNDDETTHMMIDKCVSELSIVLDLIQRNNEKETSQKA